MITRSKIKNTLVVLSGAILLGSFVQATSAEAGHWHGWGGYDRHVVHRPVLHRPLVRRVIYVDRPLAYRPRPLVRRVVIVERPFYPRLRYGWRHRGGYGAGWHHRRWHNRPRCFLPERYLCR